MNANADLLPEVLEFSRQNGLLPTGGRIVVGFSGGPDSLALLDLLHRLAQRHGFTVVAAHLNHCLRGPAADADEAVVRRVCDALGIRLHVRRVDVAAEAEAHGHSLEEAGRRARYAFFETIAQAEAASVMAERANAAEAARSANPEARHSLYRHPDTPPPDSQPMPRLNGTELEACLQAGVRVAVGHHRNDQAETVLLNLGRGSGIDGLAGMMPQNGLIIRPLLDTPRDAIDTYVRWRGLEPCLDATNLETAATRNRLRHQVLPALSAAFGFDAVPALARTARLLRQDADFLRRQAADALQRLRTEAGQPDGRRLPGQIAALPVPDAAALHPAILSRVLRLWYQESFGDIRDLSERQVAVLAGLCAPGRSGRRASLPNGRQAVRDFDWLILLEATTDGRANGSGGAAEASLASAAGSGLRTEPPVPQAPSESGDEQPLAIPGTTEIPGGGLFVTQFIVDPDEIVYNESIWCFPLTSLDGAVVRRRRPHDHFRAEGSAHGKTLKKLFCERQVPAGLRDSLPLIACGDRVLWIPGVAAAARLPEVSARPVPPLSRWLRVRLVLPEAGAGDPSVKALPGVPAAP